MPRNTSTYDLSQLLETLGGMSVAEPDVTSVSPSLVPIPAETTVDPSTGMRTFIPPGVARHPSLPPLPTEKEEREKFYRDRPPGMLTKEQSDAVLLALSQLAPVTGTGWDIQELVNNPTIWNAAMLAAGVPPGGRFLGKAARQAKDWINPGISRLLDTLHRADPEAAAALQRARGQYELTQINPHLTGTVGVGQPAGKMSDTGPGYRIGEQIPLELTPNIRTGLEAVPRSGYVGTAGKELDRFLEKSKVKIPLYHSTKSPEDFVVFERGTNRYKVPGQGEKVSTEDLGIHLGGIQSAHRRMQGWEPWTAATELDEKFFKKIYSWANPESYPAHFSSGARGSQNLSILYDGKELGQMTDSLHDWKSLKPGIPPEAVEAVYRSVDEAGDPQYALDLLAQEADTAAQRHLSSLSNAAAVSDPAAARAAALPYQRAHAWLTKNKEKFTFKEMPYRPGYETPEGQRILPVYASIKNPILLPDVGDWQDPIKVVKALLKGGHVTETKALALASQGNLNRVQRMSNIRQELKRMGHDSVAYINKGEVGGPRPQDKFSYIVFDPEQIKSAIGNRGTFDPSKSSILRAVPPVVGLGAAASQSGDSGGEKRQSISDVVFNK